MNAVYLEPGIIDGYKIRVSIAQYPDEKLVMLWKALDAHSPTREDWWRNLEHFRAIYAHLIAYRIIEMCHHPVDRYDIIGVLIESHKAIHYWHRENEVYNSFSFTYVDVHKQSARVYCELREALDTGGIQALFKFCN